MKNLELKVRISDKQQYKDISTKISKYYRYGCNQRDTYYKTKEGRFKIRREENDGETFAEMIYYKRPDNAEAKISDYMICRLSHSAGDGIASIINSAFEREIIVSKDREIYQYKNARIHLDTVYGLNGHFLEIEVVFGINTTDENAQELMNELITLLDISTCEKISIGYRELLLHTRA